MFKELVVTNKKFKINPRALMFKIEDMLRIKIVEPYFKYIKKNRGEYILNKDWDNLIILDACRYDTFVEVSGIKCDYIISRGSSTPEFLKENFKGRRLNDIVYVTANPQVNIHVKDCFYKIVPAWKYAWNDEIGTVFPEDVYRYALKAEKAYPNKRLIIHFVQPHFPFLDYPELSAYGFKEDYLLAIGKKSNPKAKINPWIEAAKGNIDPDIVWRAYKKNLKRVLPYALKLTKKLKGKCVITSDHGEALRRIWFPVPVKIAEHASHIYIEDLIKVPWYAVEKNERKEICHSDKMQVAIRKAVEKIKGM